MNFSTAWQVAAPLQTADAIVARLRPRWDRMRNVQGLNNVTTEQDTSHRRGVSCDQVEF